jgi:hypothetical protein
MKLSPDSKLASLSREEQRKLIFRLVEKPFRDAREELLEEGGFWLEVSESELLEFYRVHRGLALAEIKERFLEMVESLGGQEKLGTDGTREGAFTLVDRLQAQAATEDALWQKALELGIAPGAGVADLKTVYALLLDTRSQMVEERKLALCEKKDGKAPQTMSPEEEMKRIRGILGLYGE